MNALHTYRFGSPDGPEILALHGLTGHGRRWEALAREHLPDARIIAPDLRGHGRSPWTPPWSIESHVTDLLGVLDAEATGPVLLVGHSYGGALALHLAARAPERVRGLVLLDPAIGLPAEWMREVADLTVRFPDYTDAAEARSEKINGSWREVPEEVLDGEIAEHLVLLDSGRVNWRLSTPAVVASWGELARRPVLPPHGLPTILVQAMQVQPPYVRPEFRRAVAAHLGGDLTVVELDCDHMVAQARPGEVAALVRTLL